MAVTFAYVSQNHIYEWVRDHRVHHKFTDTNADPHNAQRGFFFSHMGWLLVRKHPDVISKGAMIDMSDLDKDPVIIWQRRYDAALRPECSLKEKEKRKEKTNISTRGVYRAGNPLRGNVSSQSRATSNRSRI